MNKNAIKKYAVWARTELIDRVKQRAERFDVYPQSELDIDSVSGVVLSDVEKEIIYDYYPHWDRYDHSSFFLRSSGSRVKYKNESIPHRETEQKMFHRGDVLIVNDNLAHYRGELEIALRDIPNDGERNLCGHVKEEEMMFLDMIEPGHYFKIIK